MTSKREPSPATEIAMTAVTDAVRSAQAAANRGEFVDLTGLDRIVAGLCAEIRAMPSAQGSDLTPRLTDLIDELTRLIETLAGQRGRVLDAAVDRTDRSAAGAAAAYRKNHR